MHVDDASVLCILIGLRGSRIRRLLEHVAKNVILFTHAHVPSLANLYTCFPLLFYVPHKHAVLAQAYLRQISFQPEWTSRGLTAMWKT